MLKKSLRLEQTELKASGDDAMQFTGYASVFGGVDYYGDTIAKGAYEKTISDGHKISLMFEHYQGVVGKWLSLEEDDKGLLVTGELTPGHSLASDVYALIKHQAVEGMSIGYQAKSWEDSDDGIRILKEIHLHEVSIVSTPADPAAQISNVKSGDMLDIKSVSDAEAYLRDSGMFSRKAAQMYISRIKQLISQSDSDLEAANRIRETISRLQNN